MNATRKISFVTKDGKNNVEIIISRTLKVEEKTLYADGWDVPAGKETVDRIEITMYANGKQVDSSLQAPHKLGNLPGNEKYIAQGAYAKLGNAMINEQRYNEIIAALAELEAELTTPEYTEIKEQEIAREVAKNKTAHEAMLAYKKEIENGLCPKCGTYCYGDCSHNH